MGVKGAAIATVIGNICSAIYYYVLMTKGHSSLSIAFADFRFKKVAKDVFSIGVPAALTGVLMTVSNIVLYLVMVRYGDHTIAAMGIAIKVILIAVLLQIGLGTSVQPLLGYNYGANNKTE